MESKWLHLCPLRLLPARPLDGIARIRLDACRWTYLHSVDAHGLGQLEKGLPELAPNQVTGECDADLDSMLVRQGVAD